MNLDLKIGDRLLIISDKIGDRFLVNVKKGEEIIITGFSDDGKIMYHNNSLALSIKSDVYLKINKNGK